MQGLLFVSQPALDGWVEAGRADVTAEGLQIGGAGARLSLTPALRVVEVLEGSDEIGLVGQVQTEAAVRALGGEPWGDSLLLGEVVYTVEPGFVVNVPLPGGMAPEAAGVARRDAGPAAQPAAATQARRRAAPGRTEGSP